MRTDQENFEIWLQGLTELQDKRDLLYLAWMAACESRDARLLDIDINQLFMEDL